MSELVTDYLERATPPRLRLDMWLHLWRCEACRHYFNQMRRTVRLLASHPAEPPGRETEERVVAAVREQDRHDA
jgi:predicted anti-sigma-YlaC factor YlaD